MHYMTDSCDDFPLFRTSSFLFTVYYRHLAPAAAAGLLWHASCDLVIHTRCEVNGEIVPDTTMTRKDNEMMKRTRQTSLLGISALLVVLSGCASRSDAGVNVNVREEGVHVTVGAEGVHVSVRDHLPVARFASPPDLVVIPGTYVYLVPDSDVDVLYYQDNWWRPFEGHWYRSRDFNGPWRYVGPGDIPGGLRALPQDYRQRTSAGYERMPHEDVKRNWKRWEKEKRWERRDRGEQGERDHGRESGHEHEGR